MKKQQKKRESIRKIEGPITCDSPVYRLLLIAAKSIAQELAHGKPKITKRK